MKDYTIQGIWNLETEEERTDKFYPDLIGKTIDLPYGLPEVGGFLYGIVDSLPLRTSRVQLIENDGYRVNITTRNTVYKLVKEA